MNQTVQTVISKMELTLSPATATPVTTPQTDNSCEAWARHAGNSNGFADVLAEGGARQHLGRAQ